MSGPGKRVISSDRGGAVDGGVQPSKSGSDLARFPVSRETAWDCASSLCLQVTGVEKAKAAQERLAQCALLARRT